LHMSSLGSESKAPDIEQQQQQGERVLSLWTSPPHTNTARTVLEKFSLTPSEKSTHRLHHNSDWLCKQLKCEISQRLSRKPFDTLKKIKRDYRSLGGAQSKTVNFAFQTTRVGDFFSFFFFRRLGENPWRGRRSHGVFSDSSKTLDIPL